MILFQNRSPKLDQIKNAFPGWSFLASRDVQRSVSESVGGARACAMLKKKVNHRGVAPGSREEENGQREEELARVYVGERKPGAVGPGVNYQPLAGHFSGQHQQRNGFSLARRSAAETSGLMKGFRIPLGGSGHSIPLHLGKSEIARLSPVPLPLWGRDASASLRRDDRISSAAHHPHRRVFFLLSWRLLINEESLIDSSFGGNVKW